MILRKVSNLRPGDVIKIHDEMITVDEIIPDFISGRFRITTNGVTRVLEKDDLVEIVIL